MLKSFWFWLFTTFIAIQFIPMDVPATLEGKVESEIEAPADVMDVLKRSCYDCHSNALTYPWYAHIAPSSWFAKSHVDKGRDIVNFSIWKEYNQEKQLKLLEKLPKSIVVRMPLSSYLWLHEEAKMGREEKKLLTEWAKKLKEEIK